jgi:hypothetical protein
MAAQVFFILHVEVIFSLIIKNKILKKNLFWMISYQHLNILLIIKNPLPIGYIISN